MADLTPQLKKITAWDGRQGRRPQLDSNSPARFDVTKLGTLLDEIHERLAGVVIECLPWADFVERYDSPTTPFYLHPPYWESETDYGASVFTRADFVGLSALLSRIAGKFLLSVNDMPEMRETFSRLTIESVATRYGRFRRQRNRGRRDRGDRTVSGCSAAGAGPVVAMIVAAVHQRLKPCCAASMNTS